VLSLTVDADWAFFAEEESLRESLSVLREVGVGYLRLGQPATELSGGEAQRIKLASELQRIQKGDTLYVLDEPTTGPHPADVEKLILQLDRLVTAGNTIVTIEREMRVAAISDWIIDIGPGAGEAGGRVVATGGPDTIARHKGEPYRTLPVAVSRYLGELRPSVAGRQVWKVLSPIPIF
jgi:excinuclease ABC subunit A